MSTRSGFVALAGRPNVGKSTLVNSMVGRKIAIVSDKPQTTRRAIRGVVTAPDRYQLVMTDLPGVQRPRDALTERMQHRVETEVAEADAALFVVNGEQGVGGPGDVFIAEALAAATVPVVVAVNKVDRLDRPRSVLALQAAADLVRRRRRGLPGLRPHRHRRRRRWSSTSPACCPRGRSTSRPRTSPTSRSTSCSPSSCASRSCTAPARRCRTRSRCRSTSCTTRTDLVIVRAFLWVETESQKGILIGARGRMIKAIGIAARRELERQLGTRVHLDLSVRVRRSWRGDETLLDRLGIT